MRSNVVSHSKIIQPRSEWILASCAQLLEEVGIFFFSKRDFVGERVYQKLRTQGNHNQSL